MNDVLDRFRAASASADWIFHRPPSTPAAMLRGLADFAETHELAWTGRAAPQSQPAQDLAAATVAWGLMDQPYDLPDTLAGSSCEQLAADYQALTLASATGGACPSPGG